MQFRSEKKAMHHALYDTNLWIHLNIIGLVFSLSVIPNQQWKVVKGNYGWTLGAVLTKNTISNLFESTCIYIREVHTDPTKD